MTESQVCGILVDASPSRGSCFIVMPFGGDNSAWKVELDQLYNAIRDAANDCNLFPKRADSFSSVEFVSAISQRVRSAQAMVVVCSPDPKTLQSNPNVLYELGIAHALGRPALLLTSDPNTLPADLKTKHALTYRPSELHAWQDLSNKIRIHLQEILDRTGDAFVDPEWHCHGIRAIKARQKMFLDEAFIGHFAAVVGFAENVRHFYQPIDHELPSLQGYVKEIYTQIGEIEEDRVTQLVASWRRYLSAFDQAAEEIYGSSLDRSGTVVRPDYLGVIENAFDFFNRSPTDDIFHAAVTRAKESYQSIKIVLDRYPGRHKTIVDEYPKIGQYLARNMQVDITEFSARIHQVTLDAQQVVLQSHNLVINLLAVL